MRHRQRASGARLGLRERDEERRPSNVGSGAPLGPWKRVQTVLDAELDQRVPRRVELHLVDALAEAVVGPKPRRVLVREPAPFERLAAQLVAERPAALLGPAAALAMERLDQRTVL